MQAFFIAYEKIIDIRICAIRKTSKLTKNTNCTDNSFITNISAQKIHLNSTLFINHHMALLHQ